jgi:hypothetical protein
MAKRLCDAILADDSLNPDANLLLSAICEEMGDTSGAISAAQRASYLLPSSAFVHFRLGTIQSNLGRQSQARKSMHNVLSLLSALPPEAAAGPEDDVTVGALRLAAQAYLERDRDLSGSAHD